MGATVNGEPVPLYEAFKVSKGDQIKFSHFGDGGFRCYMALAGGVDVPVYLGSKSTCVFGSYGGFDGRPLTAGDEVKVGTAICRTSTVSPVAGSRATSVPSSSVCSSCAPFPARTASPDYVTEAGMDYLFSNVFKTQLTSNRSAYRIDEIPADVGFFARTDGGVGGSHPSNVLDHAYAIRGTMNVCGNTPILLIADGPTLGGYLQLPPGHSGRPLEDRPGDAGPRLLQVRLLHSGGGDRGTQGDARVAQRGIAGLGRARRLDQRRFERERMDINVDMGESFGRYTLGDDEGIMKAGATSANIATCFHAGDPNVLLRTVRWAKQYGLNVGVHTGLPDMQGFGRRRMDITGDELYADTLYQIGAIAAVCWPKSTGSKGPSKKSTSFTPYFCLR